MASSPCRELPRDAPRRAGPGQTRCHLGPGGVSGGSGRPPPPPRSRAEPPRPAEPGRLGQGAVLGKRGRKVSLPRLCVSPLIFAPVTVGSATFTEPRRREAAPRCSAERSPAGADGSAVGASVAAPGRG